MDVFIIIIIIINVLLLSANSHFVDLLRSTRYENKIIRKPKSNLYINLRRSHDGSFVRACGVRVFLTLDSFSSLLEHYGITTAPFA